MIWYDMYDTEDRAGYLCLSVTSIIRILPGIHSPPHLMEHLRTITTCSARETGGERAEETERAGEADREMMRRSRVTTRSAKLLCVVGILSAVWELGRWSGRRAAARTLLLDAKASPHTRWPDGYLATGKVGFWFYTVVLLRCTQAVVGNAARGTHGVFEAWTTGRAVVLLFFLNHRKGPQT